MDTNELNARKIAALEKIAASETEIVRLLIIIAGELKRRNDAGHTGGGAAK